jgi:hypothetical protein
MFLYGDSSVLKSLKKTPVMKYYSNFTLENYFCGESIPKQSIIKDIKISILSLAIYKMNVHT